MNFKERVSWAKDKTKLNAYRTKDKARSITHRVVGAVTIKVASLATKIGKTKDVADAVAQEQSKALAPKPTPTAEESNKAAGACLAAALAFTALAAISFFSFGWIWTSGILTLIAMYFEMKAGFHHIDAKIEERRAQFSGFPVPNFGPGAADVNDPNTLPEVKGWREVVRNFFKEERQYLSGYFMLVGALLGAAAIFMPVVLTSWLMWLVLMAYAAITVAIVYFGDRHNALPEYVTAFIGGSYFGLAVGFAVTGAWTTFGVCVGAFVAANILWRKLGASTYGTREEVTS